MRGLYIHIPFCEKICSYCDFCKMIYQSNLADLYIDEVIKEIEEKNINEVSSIYIGGGTPSSLSEEQIDKLLNYLDRFIYPGLPFSFECNVENLTDEKIEVLKKHHVNRISLGVQSFNPILLKIMNREHTFQQVNRLIQRLHDYEIFDINCDLIYGFKGQSLKDLNDDLNQFLKLDITHISTYALMINHNTVLGIKNVKEIDQDQYREQYDFIYKFLKNHCFNRYEVSNFSKIGYESKHNLIYWNNQEYYGIGIGASGYINSIRYDNTKSIFQYLSGKREINEEKIENDNEEFYYLMLKLRLTNGFNLSEFNKKFKVDFLEKYKDKVDSLLKSGLVEIKNDNFKITDENLYIMDYILNRLL